MKPIWLILKPGISAGSANGTGPLPPRGPRKIKRTPYPEVPDCDMSHPPLQSAALVLLERHWHECMKSSTFGLCRPTNGTLGSPWKLFSLLSGLDGPRAIGQSLRNRRVLVNLPVSPAQSTSGPFILSAPPSASPCHGWCACVVDSRPPPSTVARPGRTRSGTTAFLPSWRSWFSSCSGRRKKKESWRGSLY